MFEKISNWLSRHGGIYHVLAVVVAFLVGAYPVVPAYHSFCLQVWSLTPPILRSLGTAAAGLWTLYATKFAIEKNLQVKLMARRAATTYVPIQKEP